MMIFKDFCDNMHRCREFIGPDFNDDEINIRFHNDKGIANCHLELAEEGDMYLVFALGVNIDVSCYPLKRVLNNYEAFVKLEQFINNIYPSLDDPNSRINRTICCVYDEHVISDVDLFHVSVRSFNKCGKPIITIDTKINNLINIKTR